MLSRDHALGFGNEAICDINNNGVVGGVILCVYHISATEQYSINGYSYHTAVALALEYFRGSYYE